VTTFGSDCTDGGVMDAGVIVGALVITRLRATSRAMMRRDLGCHSAIDEREENGR